MLASAMDWLSDLLREMEFSWTKAFGGLALAGVLFLFGTGAAAWIIVRLPVDYFQEPRVRHAPGESSLRIWCRKIGKNLAGGLLISFGILLSLPGIPGPGFLVILLGLTLVNFPGKRRLELKLLGFAHVRRALDRLRHLFGRPALELPGQDPPAAAKSQAPHPSDEADPNC